ncbi:MAG: radical SAM family heme chaperone HemW [Acholeplasmatales bacterium]|nr:MAG: radical SAM family heme chaperone HemW [Acholeplasmatales bacterium]
MRGLYVHIPFCRTICTYCDFVKEVGTLQKRGRYLEALMKEIVMVEASLSDVQTLYFGGGTPSLYDPEALKILLQTIHARVDPKHVVETTIECNPEDVTASFAQGIKALGIDRVSLGVQTFQPTLLDFLHRKHTAETAINAMRHLRLAGFTRISIDMISGLMGQTMPMLEDDLKQLLHLEPDHVSYYSLILEENTRLWHLMRRGLVTPIDEDLEADMIETVVQTLKHAGYEHYEISNFARPNQASRHNLLYWQDEDYVGVGAGAHGRIGAKRHENIHSVKHYIEAIEAGRLPRVRTVPVEGMKEALMMGLRLTRGVSLEQLEKRYGQPVYATHPRLLEARQLGLLEEVAGFLRFTSRGRMLGNEVLTRL